MQSALHSSGRPNTTISGQQSWWFLSLEVAGSLSLEELSHFKNHLLILMLVDILVIKNTEAFGCTDLRHNLQNSFFIEKNTHRDSVLSPTTTWQIQLLPRLCMCLDLLSFNPLWKKHLKLSDQITTLHIPYRPRLPAFPRETCYHGYKRSRGGWSLW